MKKTPYNFALAAALALLTGQFAQAGDLTIITHPGVSLTMSDVRDLYVGEKQFAGSTKLTPIENAVLQEDFLSSVIQLPKTKYSSLWGKKSFRDGMVPPAVKSGDVEVIEFVKHTPGAVGYVSSSPAGVNIVK
jgi:hypothetical protein